MKKQNLKKFHRKTIAVAAHRLFMEKSLAQTTMDEIAKKAEYSKATIYVYFKSKEEIFLYNALRGWEILYGEVQKILKEDVDVETAYYSLCDAVVSLYDEYPIYFSSILQTIASDEKSRQDSLLLDKIYQIGEKLNTLILSLLVKGEQERIFQSGCANLETAMMIWSSLAGIISFATDKEAYLSSHISKDKKEYLHYCFSLLLQAILKKEDKNDEK